MTRRTTIAVALDGAGWHPAAWRDPSARPARALQSRLLDRPGTHRRTSGRRLPHDRGRARPAVLGLRHHRRPHRPGARPPRRPAHRLRHRADDEPHRARAHGHDHAHRAVPRRDRPADARLREPRSGGMAGAGLGGGARGRVTSAAEASHPSTSRPYAGATPPSCASCSTRPATSSRSCGASGTAGRTTPSSGMPRPRRFVDRDKLHYADFEGAQFSVKGPSITPRSPQGQPLVTALAHQTIPYELAATSADLVFVTPHDDAQASSILGEVRDAEFRVGREGRPLSVLADARRAARGDSGAGDRRARTPRRRARRARDIRCPHLRRHARGARRAASTPGPTSATTACACAPPASRATSTSIAEWVLPAFEPSGCPGRRPCANASASSAPPNRHTVEETAA